MRQKTFAMLLDLEPANLCRILSGKRGISKKKAMELQKKSEEHGYPFSANDWMFEPTKIKELIMEL